MQILFHIGAHSTDGGTLIRSILKNRAALSREGISVPGPGRYRHLLRDATTSLRGEYADPETEAMLLDAILDDASSVRMVLSNENFICRPDVAFGDTQLYPKAEKSAWLAACFPSHGAEFAISLRNPATFLPALLTQIDESGESHANRLADVGLTSLLWSDVIARIRDANPDSRIIVWCNEDTPFVWSEVIREITGHDVFTSMTGEFDVLEQIMSEEGMQRLTEFLSARDISSTTLKRRAIAAFLEAHALDEEIDEEVDLPGWTDDTVQALTEIYEEDVARIASMPGVTFVAP